MRPFIVALLEIRSFLTDKADLAFALLLPIVTFALLYGAFGGQTQFNGTAYIVDNDKGLYSKRLVDGLKEIDGLNIELLSASEADSKLNRSSLLLALYIPEGFSEKLASGEPAQLLFRQRGNGGQEGQIVASMVNGVAQDIAQEFQVKSQVTMTLAETNIPQAQINATVDQFLAQQRQHPIVEVKEETVGTSPDPVRLYLFGIITMYALFAVTLNARVIVEERQKGTLERLLTTQLTAGELFIGKFLANFARGLVQMLILLILSYAVFRIFTPLSFVQTLVVVIIFAAAVSALGLVIASVTRTADQANWIAAFFTMFMVMLGGTFFKPVSGSVLYLLGKISVNTYANNAFETIVAQGGSLARVGLELGVLAGVAVVGLTLSRLLFKTMPGGK